MGKSPSNPTVSGNVLDVELHCARAGCAATEIRVRVDPPRPDWLQTLRDREWRCPLCAGRATVGWIQIAAVTEHLEQLLRSHHRIAFDRLNWH